MDKITVDFRQFQQSHMLNRPTKIITSRTITPKTGLEASLLQNSLELAGNFNSTAKLGAAVTATAQIKPKLIWLPSATDLAPSRAGRPIDFTIGLGIQGTAGLGAGATAGAGVYGSNSGEIGFYGDAGVASLLNATASIGVALTVMSGAPTEFFSGSAAGIGYSSGSPGVKWGTSVMIYFDQFQLHTYGKYVPCGVSWSVDFGAALLPVTLTVTYTYTSLYPVVLIT
jgi:hypothetical protein